MLAKRQAKLQKQEAAQEVKARRQEALKSLRAQLDSTAGQAESALLCAGLSPEEIEVTHFVADTRPPPGETHVPGQMIAVDHQKGCVVVALRNSMCLMDAIVDLDCEAEPFSFGGKDGSAHGGMLRAAQKLDMALQPAVEEALCKLQGPRRVLVLGHSLGAGVATLLTTIWLETRRFPSTELKCLAFACPQVLDAELVGLTKSYTTSFVVGEDTVPCLSLATATELRDAIVHVAREHEPKSILEAAAQGEVERLVSLYEEVRTHLGKTSICRLYPAGRILKLSPGSTYLASLGIPVPCDVPREVSGDDFQEMIITSDMVLGHLPRRYLAALQDAPTDTCTGLWNTSLEDEHAAPCKL
jgi:hypothetical protein